MRRESRGEDRGEGREAWKEGGKGQLSLHPPKERVTGMTENALLPQWKRKHWT